MFWKIASFPKCPHHVFLSHCAEDRTNLVAPVFERLKGTDVVPWLDQEDYYYGRNSRAALRDGILRSRHVVFFVTEAMLSTARGWCILELAFAETLELNFQFAGGQVLNSFLPLFLIPQTDDRLPRSVWQATRDRGQFFRPDQDLDQASWCVKTIREFLVREQSFSREMAELTRQDPAMKRRMQEVPGLFDRTCKFQPNRLKN